MCEENTASLPTFKTQRLCLSPVTMADVGAYKKHFIDYEVVRQLSAKIPWPYPANEISEFIQNQILTQQGKQKWAWGIRLLSNPDELIGTITLMHPDQPLHRAFWLGKAFWGQGIMTEAASVITDHAFNSLGFSHLIFGNAVGNIASRRLKERAGAKLIEIQSTRFVDPSLNQLEIWKLEKADWQQAKQTTDTAV